jgi:hypothetical protein
VGKGLREAQSDRVEQEVFVFHLYVASAGASISIIAIRLHHKIELT